MQKKYKTNILRTAAVINFAVMVNLASGPSLLGDGTCTAGVGGDNKPFSIQTYCVDIAGMCMTSPFIGPGSGSIPGIFVACGDGKHCVADADWYNARCVANAPANDVISHAPTAGVAKTTGSNPKRRQ